MCGCAAFLGLYATQGILPQIAATFGTRIEQAALGITVTTVAMAATAPFVGMLTRRFDRRRVITLAALLVALPTLWTAHADSFAEFLAGRIATGIVIPVLFAVTVSYVGETWEGNTTTEMTSFFIAGTTLGGFGGRFIVNGVTAMSGWPRALDALACAMLAAGAAICLCLPRTRATPPAAADPAAMSLRALGRNRPVLASYFIGACILFSQVTTFTYVGLYLAKPPYRFGTAAIGSIYAVFLLAVVVTPMAARLSRRRPPADLLALASGLGVAGALLTLHAGVPVILLGLAIGSTGVFVGQAAASAFVTRSTSEGRTFAVGLYLSFYYLGGSAGTVLPVPAWQRFGWAGCVALVVCAHLLAAIAAWTFWKPGGIDATRTRPSSITTPR
ncbi:sugar (and other) transporter family protein [Burkholderia oklahomensis]|uniref:Sugar (And other) transporter family protein n=2 Tax=Burkholderia oklahomensis TaxID=342113 RepID=A0AAI8FKU9_9BURK|nr:MFS transporter [Burkholderia oklahomensis]AIO64861.1 sugar (and other) transporter family protein [Burkholderia oklahomensis]AJX33764.1 sugar (and other) transporter family protein [Burkholderia oklahomensis C6786]SUW59469.1 Inner membrane transport protein ynfM [Burkholderia oklahomensis]